ncbi:MAG: DUF881 domain-containing protein [Actinomycetes bacterium]
MDLLNQLRDEALDPSYASAVAAHGGRRKRPGLLLPALVVVGMIFGMALANTWRTAPAAAREREDLVARITATEERLDAQRVQEAALNREIAELGLVARGLDPSAQQRYDQLASWTGAVPVSGPGVRITVDDGADSEVRGSRVVDADLRMAVNGLWASGAEAVAINGHRLSVRTPIRTAGDAITVDYRSLSRPYVVEAIGDPQPLEAAFRASEGGLWLAGLEQHFGVLWRLEPSNDLSLAADSGLGVRYATRER